MSKKFTRKRIVAAVAAVSVAAVAAVAIAYWTTTATGTGSGSVSSAAAVVQLTGTITNQLHPGGSSPVTITATKGETALKIGTVTGTVSVDTTSAGNGCSASDFSFSTTAGDQTVAAGTGTQALTSGTASMTNTGVNQDACKGATLSIALTAGAPSAP